MSRGGIVAALSDTGDEVVIRSTEGGSLFVSNTPNTEIDSRILSKAFGVATSGDNTLIAGVANKRIRFHGGMFHAASTVSLYMKSSGSSRVLYGDSTNKVSSGGASDPGGFAIPFNPVGWFTCDAGDDLEINLSGAIVVSGVAIYTLVDVGPGE